LGKAVQLTVIGLASSIAEADGVTLEEAAASVWERAERGEIRIVDPDPPVTYPGYLSPTYSAWLWLLVAALATMLASVYLLPQAPPFTLVRALTGFLACLYLPGYALIEALYPQRRELEELERVTLSVGLSLALTPLMGLVLNYTPWGIRLDPVALSVTSLTLVLGLIASYRKYRYHALALRMAK
jgi:hypothetical protein